MEGETNQLKVLGLPEDVTKDELKVFFQNRRRQGGGPVKRLHLDKKKHSAVITFEKSDAVHCILSRGDTVEIKEQIVKVEAIYGSDSSMATQSDDDDDKEVRSASSKTKPARLPKSKKKKKGQDSDGSETSQSESDDEEEKARSTTSKSKTKKKKTESSTCSKSAMPKLKKKKKGKNSDSSEESQSESDDEEEPAKSASSKSKTSASAKTKKKKKESSTDSKSAMPKPKKKKKVHDSDSNEISLSESEDEEEKARSTKSKSKTSALAKTKKKKIESSTHSKSAMPKSKKKKKGKTSESSEETQSESDDEEEPAKSASSKSKTSASAKSKKKKIDSSKGSKSKSKKKKKGHDSDSSEATQSESDDEEENVKYKPSKSKHSALPKSKKKKLPVNDAEDDKEVPEWDLTIKATVKDVNVHQMIYRLYLEDASVSQGPFDEKTMLLDGAKKILYVTFNSRQAAINTCNYRHGEDSNFEKVEMSTADDFNTHPSLMSVHGFRFNKEELKSFVEKQTKIPVMGIIMEEEPRSAIVVFDPRCEDVSQALWACAETPFKDNRTMITAPVFMSFCLKVTGLTEKTTDSNLKLYLGNKLSGGGGRVMSVKRLSESEAIVTIEDEDSYNGILQKKNHLLAGNSFQVASHYPCLECEFYDQYIARSVYQELEDDGSEMQGYSSPQQVSEPRKSRPPVFKSMDAGPEAEEDKKYSQTKREPVEEKDLIFLQKLEFHKDAESTCDVKISYNFDDLCVVVTYNEEKEFTKLQVELLKKLREIQSRNLQDLFSPDQLHVLKRKSVQDKINSIFDENGLKAHFKYSTDNAVQLYYLTGTATDFLVDVVKSQALVKYKSIDEDTLRMFKSDKGQKFLAEHFQGTDSLKTHVLVKLLQDKRQLLIIAPKGKLDKIDGDIDRFIKETSLCNKQIPLPSGKQTFIRKYCSDEVKEIEKALEPLGTKLSSAPGKFILQGLEDGVKSGEKKLSQLIDNIQCKDHTLNFFGIKEFIQDQEGKSLLNSVGEKHSCIVLSQADATSQPSASARNKPAVPPKPTRTIARAELNDCDICFLQGDITALKADAFVNPLDKTRKCSSALGKAVISKGGYGIQKELQNARQDESVIVTTAGSSIPCKAIIHAICPVFDSDHSSSSGKLEQSVIDCLNCAKDKGFKSVAFPLLGSGKQHGFPTMAASNVLAKAVSNYLMSGTPGFAKIFFCDVQPKSLETIMDRWESTTQGKLERLVDLSADGSSAQPSQRFTPKGAPHHHGPPPTSARSSNRGKDFKHLQVGMELGEITKQKTDVIVITANKSLDLSKGAMCKAVLKYGGDSVQDELNNIYPQGIQPGEVAKSSGGKLQCQNIFHACLSHSKGGNDGKHLEELVSKILDMANTENATSISIPALGTGGLSYPADVAARAITDAISKFAHKNSKSSLKSVKLVIFPKDTAVAQTFQAELSGGGGRGSGVRKGKRFGDDEDSNNDGEDDDDGRQASGGGGRKPRTMFTYGSVNLKIKKGNIIEKKCDAIVSGVKDTMDLSASGAVAKAVLKKCGQSLQDECSQKKNEMAQAGFVMTSAPGLNCNSIFHVSMDKFHHSWDKCIVQILTAAENQGIKSIALPALGSGGKSADYQRIKKMIFSGVEKYGNSGRHSLTDVRLVLFSQDLMDEFVGSGHSHKAHSPRDQGNTSSATKQKLLPPSKSETVKIYFDKNSAIKSVVKELNDVFKDAFKDKKITKEEIKKMSKEQVKLLEEKGLQHCIRVSVNLKSGQLVMEGFKEKRMAELTEMFHEVVIDIVNQHHNQLHQAVKSTIKWQFKLNGKWRDFELMPNMLLEREYQKKAKRCEISDSRGRKYRINFEKKTESQLDDKGKKVGDETEVRRYDVTQEGEPLPSAWDAMGKDQNLLLVMVAPGSKEFNKVEQHLKNNGATEQIKKIERIQNKTLYQQYSVTKRAMESRNPKGHENEKRLFHGTDTNTIPKINETGFNRSYCGKNATFYGDGVYFATASSYSVGYAAQDPSSGVRQMYQARVLVGESTPSTQGMKTLPYKSGNIPYDSGTDGNGMYIIFHDCQAYPEYLLTF